uniref:Putative tubulin polyglutamylase TTLL1 n=1 Tax=Lygus hesperus TaxID=30085 RepID=A0A0A9YQE9_LYGHE
MPMNVTPKGNKINTHLDKPKPNLYTGTFIVSKYINHPLLIAGRKFDLRLYVLVTSFNPLVAYLHEEGFARFCATVYQPHHYGDTDLSAHLTNVALQKHKSNYNIQHGGKLSWANVVLYVASHYGDYVATGLRQSVSFLIYHSLRAMESVMHNDTHSFELYGYDILLDNRIQPHLIEVNASPSFSTTTHADR